MKMEKGTRGSTRARTKQTKKTFGVAAGKKLQARKEVCGGRTFQVSVRKEGLKEQ